MSETTINKGSTPFDQEQSMNRPEERAARAERARKAADVGEYASEHGVVDSTPVKK